MLLLPTLEMDLAPYKPLISHEIEALEGDSTVALYRYWQEKRAGDEAPDRTGDVRDGRRRSR